MSHCQTCPSPARKTYENRPLRDDILQTLKLIEPHAEALGSTEALRHLRKAIHEGSDATWLRRQFNDQGSAEGMVNAAIARFRGHDADEHGLLHHLRRFR